MSEIRSQLTDAMKAAMRAKDQVRLGTIRMLQAAIKQVEVDERIEPDDARVLAILDKQLKQRTDSAKQYREAGRDDLADKEDAEIDVIRDFLPQPLSDDEIATLIDQAIADTGASGMQDMGKVMGMLKPKMQGRADMGKVSGQIKGRLS